VITLSCKHIVLCLSGKKSMNTTSANTKYQGFSQLKLFLALSRTHHLMLDLATPCLGALLWLGKFPALDTIGLGLLTAFAGYTAVYALNDLVDYRTDKEKFRCSDGWDSGKELDSIYARHPLAQGLLRLKNGIAWAVAWGALALIGAYLLHPICALIFVLAALLETVYCLLLRVTSLRTMVSGVVKTSGGIAAVFAVDPNPSLLFLLVFFLWVFSWEIGGQNVPNDWMDVGEDKELRARTVPVQLGLRRARLIIMASLLATVCFSLALPVVTKAVVTPLFYIAACAAGGYLLLLPAYRLYRTQSAEAAAQLFGKASYYQVVMLILVVVDLVL